MAARIVNPESMLPADKKGLMLVTLLLGVFIGALDSGIISPVRTLIERSMGVEPTLGIWVITIYTLVYAVSMPLVGKLADRQGRRKVFRVCIVIFGLGSLCAGLANFMDSFAFLMIARMIQAVGAGGITPIATAEIGQAFPPAKRGMALGLIGAVFGVATVLGPTAGSLIVSLAGQANWGWIFFINVPIALAVALLAGGLANRAYPVKKRLDLPGTALIMAIIFFFMYGLVNLKLSDFFHTIIALNVWPFFLAAAVLVYPFLLVEARAADPIINLSYFRNREIILVLVISAFTGIGLMGIIFVPQFAENMLGLKSGSGGYIVTAMAVFSGVAAPLGGRLIDRIGARKMIIIGFGLSVAGCLLLGFFANNLVRLLFSLIFVGLGIGFTMGTPLNYLMLKLVPPEEAAAGLAVLNLVRSAGTTLGPGLMAGFLADAGKGLLPALAAKVPFFANMPMGSGGGAGQGMMNSFKTADVTTIFTLIKEAMPAFVRELIGPQLEAARRIIERVYQTTLNRGFRNIFLTTALISAAGIILTLVLREKSNTKAAVSSAEEEAELA